MVLDDFGQRVQITTQHREERALTGSQPQQVLYPKQWAAVSRVLQASKEGGTQERLDGAQHDTPDTKDDLWSLPAMTTESEGKLAKQRMNAEKL